MKKLFTFLSLFCAVVCANAVTYSWDAGTHTLTFNFNEEGSYDQNYINNNYKNDIAKIVVVGTVTSNQISEINNFLDQNKGQYLDLFQATINVADLNNVWLRAAKIALPNGADIPDPVPSAWNSGNQLRYVCSLDADGSTLHVAGVQHNNYPNAIYDAMHGPDPYFPGSDGVGQNIHAVVLTGTYSQTDKDEVDNFNANQEESTYENGTLKVSRHDYDFENGHIIGKAAELIAANKNNITKIQLPDGSVWEGSNSEGSLYSVSEANLAEATAILADAGFSVNSTEVKVGSHVTIKDGVVVVTSETTGQISNTSLSVAEKGALGNAKSLKLVGPFNNDPDFLTLGALAQQVETVDLKDAIIEEGTPSYTYYYLDDEADKEHKRKVLTHDDNGWYYTEDGNRVYVAEKDVRIFTASVSGGQKLPDGWKSTLTTLYLPENDDYNVTGADFANGFTNLTNVNIPQNITVLGDKAFYECASLKDAELPTNLKVIGYEAFYKTALEKITIPGSVEIIEYMAFTECEEALTLIFAESEDSPDHHMIMKYYAMFNLCNLTDIYIENTSNIDCENEAFDYRITWGQGDVEAPFCTLHFSSKVAKHYANLAHPLTAEIAKDPARFHNWLHAHYQYSSNPGGNGWWEFVNNGTSEEEDEPIGAKFLRTFSDYNYDRIVPEGVKAYAVTNVTKNDDNTFSVDLMQLLVIPKRTGVILYGKANSKDKNGNPALSMSLCEIANGLPLRRDYWYALEDKEDHHLRNYLWPTCVSYDALAYKEEPYMHYYLDEHGNVEQDEDGDYRMQTRRRYVLSENEGKFEVLPWDNQTDFDNEILSINTNLPEDDNNKPYDARVLNGFYRNFYLNYYGTTDPGKGYPSDNDFIGFFRAKRSQMDTNHAFLRLRSDEFDEPTGAEVIVNPDTQKYKDASGQEYNMESYQVEYTKTNGTPRLPAESGYWIKGATPDLTWENPDNWGERPDNFAIQVKFIGEPIMEDENGHATMIIKTEADSVNDSYYYTLQGVRLAKPSVPGVYIHNGKKVVIK